MLDAETFKKFTSQANCSHQQFCVWFAFNNEYAKHQDRWNKFYPETYFAPDDFDKTKGCKYKNFWDVTLASTQHGWILGVARLFDPAFPHFDKKQEKPRISLDYILGRVKDQKLSDKIRQELDGHKNVVESLRKHRDNALAHNDAVFDYKKIEAGIEDLFEWLEDVISRIKKSEPQLSSCGVVNVKYHEKLSKCGVDEVFETLLLGEQHEVDEARV